MEPVKSSSPRRTLIPLAIMILLWSAGLQGKVYDNRRSPYLNIDTRVKVTSIGIFQVRRPFCLSFRLVNKVGTGENLPDLLQEFAAMAGLIINNDVFLIAATGGVGFNYINQEFTVDYAGQASVYVYILRVIGVGVSVHYLPGISPDRLEVLGGISIRLK